MFLFLNDIFEPQAEIQSVYLATPVNFAIKSILTHPIYRAWIHQNKNPTAPASKSLE